MSYIGNQPTSVAFLTDQFSGTGSQTAFTLSAAPANTASILVAVSGVLQDPTTYSTAGLTLTFSSAPPSGTGNISVRYLGIPASNITTTAYRTLTEFTATAGQTTFTPPSYTAGYINVLRNGVQLGTADFTATNGTTVVLANGGAAAGDLVTTESFYVSSVLNAIPAVAGAVTNAYLGAISTFTTPTSKTVTLPDATGTVMVSGNMPAFSAQATSTQSISNATYTKVTLGTENFDTNNNFASSTFTPTVAGYYQINAAIFYNSSATTGLGQIFIYKNGSSIANAVNTMSATGYCGLTISTVVYCNGSTDYIDLYTYHSFATAQSTSSGASVYMAGSMVRSA